MAKKRVTVLVDGFNLYHGLRAKYRHRYLWLDLDALARNLLHPDQRLEGVYYFTARVRNDPPAEQRQDLYLTALDTRASVTIVEGRFQRKTQKCRSCRQEWSTFEEKESDVNLAVKLVELAATKAYDTSLLLSADSDLCPAVRTAKRLHPRGRLVVVFPPARRSDELRQWTDADLRLGHGRIRQSQLPTTIDGPTGPIERPGKWH